MAGVFNTDQTWKSSFKADKMAITFAGKTVEGMLIQNIQFNYTQQVTVVYEIGGIAGTSYVYYVGGRAQGTATVGRIMGPGADALWLLNTYGDICDPDDLGLDGSSNCTAGTGINYTMEDAVLTSVGASVAAQDIVIHEQLQFMFLNLDAS